MNRSESHEMDIMEVANLEEWKSERKKGGKSLHSSGRDFEGTIIIQMGWDGKKSTVTQI